MKKLLSNLQDQLEEVNEEQAWLFDVIINHSTDPDIPELLARVTGTAVRYHQLARAIQLASSNLDAPWWKRAIENLTLLAVTSSR